MWQRIRNRMHDTGPEPPLPGWARPRRRPRILVEATEPVAAWAVERILTEEGYDVLLCGGPASRGGHCPLLEGHLCPGAEGADGIVFALDVEDPRDRRILEAHRRQHPNTPVCVDLPITLRGTDVRLVDGDATITHTATRREIVDAVERMLRG